jgi:hypothetical protein
MKKPNKAVVPPPEPAPPTDYEKGVTDCLAILRQEASRMNDAHREATRLLWDASHETQTLLNFANPAINIVGDVANRVEKRAIRLLNERSRAGKATS